MPAGEGARGAHLRVVRSVPCSVGQPPQPAGASAGLSIPSTPSHTHFGEGPMWAAPPRDLAHPHPSRGVSPQHQRPRSLQGDSPKLSPPSSACRLSVPDSTCATFPQGDSRCRSKRPWQQGVFMTLSPSHHPPLHPACRESESSLLSRACHKGHVSQTSGARPALACPFPPVPQFLPQAGS